MLYRVTICTNDLKYTKQLAAKLQNDQISVYSQRACRYNLNSLARQNSDMFIIGHNIIDNPSTFVSTLKELPEQPYIIILGDVKDLVETSHLWVSGCDQVLYEHMKMDELADVIANTINQNIERINSQSQTRKQHLPHISDFISESSSMKDFVNIVERVAKTDVSLLILGETGVGKERLARAIHNDGTRRDGPFIAINCAALPETLLESELFGHEAGAFTGAVRNRKGAFEQAHKGTIFLDEIGDMPLHLQAKLLRVLQEQEFMRVGGEKNISVDVRIIAATNRNLKADVEKGEFRRDLYYRLSVVTLEVPALSERRADIPQLIANYLKILSIKINPEVKSISNNALHVMQDYHWPGNVRELINVIERAILLCDSEEITLMDLPQELQQTLPDDNFPAQNLINEFIETGRSWKELRSKYLEQVENEYFTKLLQHNSGIVSQAASQAGITTRALYDKMSKYGIDKKAFKK